MPYTGQNLIHMIILHKNYKELKWVLNFYSKRDTNNLNKLLTEKVSGSHYNKDGKFYYGELPIHFAVSMNNIEIFDLILSYMRKLDNFNDLIFLPDKNGNNIIFVYYLIIYICMNI